MVDTNTDPVANKLRQNMSTLNQDKSVVSKILSEEEIKELAGSLLSVKQFTRADCNKLQYLLNGKELKLSKLGENQRYVHNKFYCWVEETLALYCMYLDYFEAEQSKLNDVDKKLYQDTLAIMTGLCKQEAYLYFHLTRSALSLEGWGLAKLVDNKVEYEYTQRTFGGDATPERKKFLGFIG